MQRAAQEDPQSEAPEPEKTNKRESSVGQRWLTAAIVMPIVLVFAWLGGWWSFAAVTLVVLLGAYELHMMLRHAGHHPIMPVTACLIMFFLVAAMFPPAQRLLILESGLSAALVISFLWLFFRKKLDGAFVDWALTLAIAVYLGWSMSFFLLLRGYEIGWPSTLNYRCPAMYRQAFGCSLVPGYRPGHCAWLCGRSGRPGGIAHQTPDACQG